MPCRPCVWSHRRRRPQWRHNQPPARSPNRVATRVAPNVEGAYRHTWQAVGVTCQVTSNRPFAPEAVVARVEAWEQALSRFRPTSELMQLNRQRQMRVSPTVHQLVVASLAVATWTNGLVVPSLGQAMRDIGYDRTFAEIGTRATDISLATPSLVPAWRDIKVQAGTVTLPPHLMLDVAGVAKGWMAMQLVAELSRDGAAVVAEIGGDVAVHAPDPADPWLITVEHPHTAGVLAEIALHRGAVATSSVLKRRWRRGGRVVHHLIDPRTGLPAQSDVATATVIADDAVYAEAAAKVAVLRGSEAALAWLDAQALPALLVTHAGAVVVSRRWHEFLWHDNQGVTQTKEPL